MIKCPCLLTQLYIKNVELCYSNLITYKSNHLFFHSYNIGFCSMQRKCQLLCYICGVAAHFYCHAFCNQRDIAHLFIIAMFAKFAVLHAIKIKALCYTSNKKSRQKKWSEAT